MVLPIEGKGCLKSVEKEDQFASVVVDGGIIVSASRCEALHIRRRNGAVVIEGQCRRADAKYGGDPRGDSGWILIGEVGAELRIGDLQDLCSGVGVKLTVPIPVMVLSIGEPGPSMITSA